MPKVREIEFEQEIKEYLSKKSKSTANAYSASFVRFLEFYQAKYGKDKIFGDFIDQIYEESKKPPREQKHIIEDEITEFIDFLKKKELSDNSIRMYVAAIQNILKYKHIPVSLSFIPNLPAALEQRVNGEKVNGKHEWKIEQIKQFVDAAEGYRDKAIILCIFQSGLAVNEICELNYCNIQDDFEKGTLPICLDLVRKKTKVEFKTFFGRDAVKYLRLYLESRGKLKPEDPLFTKQRARGGEDRINTILIEQMFSEIAAKVDFIKLQKGHYNPARPHSIRAAFNTRLIGKGIEETLREFWMGHAVGKVARTYLQMPTDDMRQLYMGAETYLKVEKTSREELDEKLRGKSVISDVLESDMKALKAKVASLETLYNKLFEVSPEELRELMQEISRRKFAQQQEEDKKAL